MFRRGHLTQLKNFQKEMILETDLKGVTTGNKFIRTKGKHGEHGIRNYKQKGWTR